MSNLFCSFSIADKMKKLALIFILIFFPACVENIITIRVHPDGRSHLQFISKGDSTDIFNSDFSHPNSPAWHRETKSTIKKDGEIVWIKNSAGFVMPGIKVRPDSLKQALDYTITSTIRKKWFSKHYIFHAHFPKVLDKYKSPLLSESLLTDKMDSIQWVPEALMNIIDSTLTQIYQMPDFQNMPYEQDRLSNHFMNTFYHIQSELLLNELSENRKTFITRTLKPFPLLNSNFIQIFEAKMKSYESKIENIIHLKDDHFKLSLILPGAIFQSNAKTLNGDTLQWEFTLKDFLNQDYNMTAKSMIYSVKDFQKIIILSTLFLLIGIWIIFRKSKSKHR